MIDTELSKTFHPRDRLHTTSLGGRSFRWRRCVRNVETDGSCLAVSLAHSISGEACAGHSRIVASALVWQPVPVGAERHTEHPTGVAFEGLAGGAVRLRRPTAATILNERASSCYPARPGGFGHPH
jgi:hypothetical protein